MRLLIVVSLVLNYFLGCMAALSNKAAKPLFLTPFIDDGEVYVARQKAKVEHEEMKDVESYAGYLTINKEYNSNTFFWYFPAQTHSDMYPLIIWMNGGPGMTSLFGLFNENGPFIITKNRTVELREYSWHRNNNIMFIDNPVGTGFSFTENENGYARNQTDIGRDVLTALLQFFQIFPEMQKNKLFVMGESGAGKYVPSVSHAIMRYNEKNDNKINLKGLACGNCFMDPINQMDFHDFLYDSGLIGSDGRKKLIDTEKNIKSLIREEKYEEAMEVYDSLFLTHYSKTPSLFTNLTGYKYAYNILQFNEPEELSYFVDWIERYDIRQALHVGDMPFTKINSQIAMYLKGDLMQSAAHYLIDLLQNHTVLLYSGVLDMAIPTIQIENFASRLNWPGNTEYQKAKSKQWWTGNDLAGYSKTAGNLCVLNLRNAGHLVPFDQSYWALDLITRFTADLGF